MSPELAIPEAIANLVLWLLIGVAALIVVIPAKRAIVLSRKSRLPR